MPRASRHYRGMKVDKPRITAGCSAPSLEHGNEESKSRNRGQETDGRERRKHKEKVARYRGLVDTTGGRKWTSPAPLHAAALIPHRLKARDNQARSHRNNDKMYEQVNSRKSQREVTTLYTQLPEKKSRKWHMDTEEPHLNH